MNYYILRLKEEVSLLKEMFYFVALKTEQKRSQLEALERIEKHVQ